LSKQLEGVKYSSGKDRWWLLPWDEIEIVVKILTYGAENKYSPFNWQKVDNWQEEYFSATMRHLSKWRGGIRTDSETGFPHLAHAICNLLFMLWLERNPIRDDGG
jgi:hypothetical protein